MSTNFPVSQSNSIATNFHPYQEVINFLGEVALLDADGDEEQAWIIGELEQITGAQSVVLYLRDESNEYCVIRKAGSLKKGENSQLIPVDEAGEVMETIRNGTQRKAQLSTGDWLYYLPLVARGSAIGAIELRTEHQELDAGLLQVITRVIAKNLSQSRRICQAEETIQEMQTFQGQLLNSRNTLRAFFDSSPASIYIVDPAYKLIAINMSRADLAGQAPQDLVGKRCFAALYQRNEPCPGCRVAETFLSAQKTCRIEHRFYEQAEGVEVEVSTFPIWDGEHQIVQVFLYEEDVTERLHLQASLAQSEKLAAVGQLAAGVAHEINNPLTAILANAQLLQRSLPAQKNGQLEMVELIIEASERASQAVRDLLDFARRERYQIAPTDLNETIQRTLALMGPELGSRSISLQFDPAIDLPLINASQDHLQGVWLNLLINAIDAIDQGPGVITIKSYRVNHSIHVTVSDSGPGIPADKISRIFEPFYTTKEPGQGTGLGLSVCHQIVTRHGGQIRVRSLPGEGATFTVILPLS
ncbi:MAG: ATP-binding protein [Anaerolineales bacterium]